jgi:hypothetical protein
MLEDIDWRLVQNTIGGSYARMPTDDIRVAFLAQNRKAPEIVETIHIRFGAEIIEELGWKVKDKIVIYFDKKDSLIFRLCKTENGKGYTLARTAAQAVYEIKFKWKDKIKLAHRSMTSVDYYVKNNQLIIFSAEIPKDEKPIQHTIGRIA